MRQSEAERSQPAGSWLEFLNIYKSNNGPRPIGLGGRHKQTGRWIRIQYIRHTRPRPFEIRLWAYEIYIERK